MSWYCWEKFDVGHYWVIDNTQTFFINSSWILTWGWDVSGRSAHMLLTFPQHSCRYCLKYCSNIWENTPLASRNIAGFYCWHSCEVELKSTLQACLGKYKELGLLLAFCYHIRTVSQWVLAAWCCRKVGDICVITRL